MSPPPSQGLWVPGCVWSIDEPGRLSEQVQGEPQKTYPKRGPLTWERWPPACTLGPHRARRSGRPIQPSQGPHSLSESVSAPVPPSSPQCYPCRM